MRKYAAGIVAGITGVICCIVYLRILAGDFANLDDPVYIVNNPDIRQVTVDSVVKLCTSTYINGWLPLTMLSFALDYQFWQLNPFGYHLTNMMLHAVNAGLVVLITNRLCVQFAGHGLLLPAVAAWRRGPDEPARQGENGGSAYLYPVLLLVSGLLFGIHPLRVESVAWISERKDVLNGFFTLGAVLFYLRYVCQHEGGTGRGRLGGNYAMALVLFFCSLLAKQVSVVVPVMLLVLDWYPLGRLRPGRVLPLLREKIPFFAGSLAVAIITIVFAAQADQLITPDAFPLYARAIVSGNAVFEYCRLWLFPIDIIPLYVMATTLSAGYIIKTAVVVVVTLLCLLARRRWPWLCAGWCLFILPLLPVLAFFHSGDDIALAPRYTYLPSVVPSILGGIGFAVADRFLARAKLKPYRLGLWLVASVLLVAFTITTIRLSGHWKNAGTLWSRQIEIKPLGRAYIYRGVFHHKNATYSAALADFSLALEIARQDGWHDIYNIHAYRGDILRLAGRHAEAVESFTAAIEMKPHPVYYYLRSVSLAALGYHREAAADLRLAGDQQGPLAWF